MKLYNIALGKEDGSLKFFTRKGMSLANTMVHIEGMKEKEITVPVERLSNYINRPIDLLKIDVQLSEGGIMEDLASSSALKNINNIIMEYHSLRGYEDNILSRILALLEGAGLLYKITLNAMKPDGFATYMLRAGKLGHVRYG